MPIFLVHVVFLYILIIIIVKFANEYGFNVSRTNNFSAKLIAYLLKYPVYNLSPKINIHKTNHVFSNLDCLHDGY
jgi:hypothetical protein